MKQTKGKVFANLFTREVKLDDGEEDYLASCVDALLNNELITVELQNHTKNRKSKTTKLNFDKVMQRANSLYATEKTKHLSKGTIMYWAPERFPSI